MTNTASILTTLESKIRRIVEQHKELRIRTEDYEKEIQELKKIDEEQKKTIRELEQQINTIRITKTLETKEGAAEAKERIAKLVREIDKCIGLLNT
jgi:hypothetical protein